MFTTDLTVRSGFRVAVQEGDKLSRGEYPGLRLRPAASGRASLTGARAAGPHSGRFGNPALALGGRRHNVCSDVDRTRRWEVAL